MIARTSTVAASSRGRDGVIAAYRAERRKLFAQASTRALALVCVFGPLAFGEILSHQGGVPADTLLGLWVHASGYAVSFVVLSFAGYLGFSVLAGAVAGDVFSSEDRYGTWKTVLTRSRSCNEVFAGKVLAVAAFSAGLVGLAALSSLAAGWLFTGDQPLVGLSGNLMSSGQCLWLAITSWSLSIPPVMAFVSIAVLFSVATRNGIVSVLGPVVVNIVMQLLAIIGSGSWVHTLLVASAFDDWHGLLTVPRFYGPLVIGNCVCLVWVVACLGAAWLMLRRRDFAGPPVSRRRGWAVPVCGALSSALLVAGLGAATSLGPVAITANRLRASIAPTFSNLTKLQQQELGRFVPEGSKLDLRTMCRRRSGGSQGPGDDWSCTMTVVTPNPGANPFQLTPVTYDVSVKSNGCYKADAPPAFVGQQSMYDARRQSVINPLFTIYGCFDTTAPAPNEEGAKQSTKASMRTPRPSNGKTKARARQSEREALRKAEQAAGPAVMEEIGESEKKLRRETEHPVEEQPPSAKK